MACTCVPHIVLHVLNSTPRISEVRLGLFLPFRATYFIKGKNTLFAKWLLPLAELAETLCVDSQTLSKYGPKSRQIAIFGFKNFVIFGGGHMLTCHVELSSPTAPYNRLPAMVYS